MVKTYFLFQCRGRGREKEGQSSYCSYFKKREIEQSELAKRKAVTLVFFL